MNSSYELRTGSPALIRSLSPSRSPHLIAGLFLMLSLVSTVPAQDPPPSLRLVADYWCPYTCGPDDAGPGILVDIIEAIFSQHGMSISYMVVPWERAKNMVAKGQADAALGLASTHKGGLVRNSLPLTHDNTVLIWPHGKGVPYTGPGVMDGKRIGVGFAYSFDAGGELDQYIAMRRESRQLISVLYQENHIEHLWRMLSSDRIDVIVEDLHALEYLFAKTKQKDFNMGIDSVDISATGISTGLYVGFTADARGRENARILDEGLARLNDTGELDAIVGAYRGVQITGQLPLPASNSEPGKNGNIPYRQDN